MSRDKQIEAMAVELWHNTTIREADMCDDVAEYLYNAGYRKASEVAREIFDKLDCMIYRLLNDRHYIVGDMCYEIAELKKKYTEEGK